MRPQDLSELFIKADNAFRNGKLPQAIELYSNCLRYSAKESHRKRSEVGIRLCRLRLKKEILFEPGQASIDHSSLAQECRRILSLNPAKAASFKSQFFGNIISPDNIVKSDIVIKHFLQSPWQTSLGLLSQLIVEQLLGPSAIRESANESFENGVLTIANVLYAYQSPLGLQQLVALFAGMQTQPSRVTIKEELFYILYQNKYLFCDIASPRMLENSLRALALEVPRYIIVDESGQDIELNSNNQPFVFAGSIFLNEIKYLQKCLSQHYSLVDKWVLVEGACRGYPTRKVTQDGLSLDCSWLSLELFPDPQRKLKYVRYGWSHADGEDAKSELRNQYLKYLCGDVLAVIDIDEFYSKDCFEEAVAKIREGFTGVVVPQIHFWKNINQFITGGYYDIQHMRFFASIQGIKYVSNHNFPEIPTDNVRLNDLKTFKFDRIIKDRGSGPRFEGVFCFHMGFVKDFDDMKDKTEYYLNRGESVSRPITTKSRAAWFEDNVPQDCKVSVFSQEILEVLRV